MKSNATGLIHVGIFLLMIASVVVSNLTSPRVVSTTFKFEINRGVNSIDQQLKIEFSRPMNQKSTAEAFSITPPVKGNVSWANNTLYFTPTSALLDDHTYSISLNNTARDVYGKKLSTMYKTSFHTVSLYFAYIGGDKQLHVSDLKGDNVTVTQNANVFDYQIRNETIVYINNSSGDTNSVYFYNLLTKQSKQLLKNIKARFSEVQISPDGLTAYLSLTPSSDTEFTGNKIIAYSLVTDQTSEIEVSSVIGQATRFWLLRDGNTILFTGNNDEFLFHLIAENQDVLVGKYIDFGGSDKGARKLIFSSLDTGEASVLLYDGKNKQINSVDESAFFPNISPDGKEISYSFNNLSSNDEKLGVKVVDEFGKMLLFSRIEDQFTFERGKISPDNRFVAFEAHDINKHQLSPYIMDSNSNEISKIEIFNIPTQALMSIHIEGRYFQWVE